MKFAFVAHTNLFADANLVSGTTVGYKAELRKYTTRCCGLRPRKTTTLGGVILSMIIRVN